MRMIEKIGMKVLSGMLCAVLALGACPGVALGDQAVKAADPSTDDHSIEQAEAQVPETTPEASAVDESAEDDKVEVSDKAIESAPAQELSSAVTASVSDKAIESGQDADVKSLSLISVDLTVQMYGGFLIPPASGVEVSGELAESYGYVDQVADGVSALDVLVRAHELAFGEEFSLETASSFLEATESGFVTRLFCEESSANGFLLNGGYPGGRAGTTVTTQAVVEGDALDFFLYQDTENWSDHISWFCQGGLFTEEVEVRPAGTVDLAVLGYLHVGAYAFDSPSQMRLAGSPMVGVRIAWVDEGSGLLKEVPGIATDGEGRVSVEAPATEGVYHLTAYTASEDIATGSSPLVMTLLTVIVDDAISEQDPCELRSLEVASFDSNPDALEMTPVFSGAVMEYAVPEIGYQSIEFLRMCYVRAVATDEDALITARLNGGAPKAVPSGVSSWTIFNGNDLLKPGNNELIVTVAESSDPDAHCRTYRVCLPMEDPDAPAKAVVALIDDIGAVTLTSGPAIAAARSAYDELPQAQRDRVSNYDVLVAAEKALAALEVAVHAKEAQDRAGAHLLQAVTNPAPSSVGGEWAVIGFARSAEGADWSFFQTYVDSLGSLLTEKDGVLSAQRYTEYARAVLALTSIGFDVTDVAGYDILEPLADYASVCRQGVNGPLWALIALDSYGYDIPEAPAGALIQATRERYVDALLAAQLPDGGWSLAGKQADPDVTAMALTALAPYEQAEERFSESIERGITRLSGFAGADAQWSSLGPEACAQTVIALSALGIDAAEDERFARQGDHPLLGLLAYEASGGGFSRIPGAKADGIASEQGFLALVAYERFHQGRQGLFSMSDVSMDPSWKVDVEGQPGYQPEEPPLLHPGNTEPSAPVSIVPQGTTFSLTPSSPSRLAEPGGSGLPSPTVLEDSLRLLASPAPLAATGQAKASKAAELGGSQLPVWVWVLVAGLGATGLAVLLCLRIFASKEQD